MDDTEDGRWLTYAELATIRGINRASAIKLVQRERWPRSSGNDRSRSVRALVPEEWLQLAKERPPPSGDHAGGWVEYTGMLAAIEARAKRADDRADEAGQRADAALALADRTLAQLTDAEAGRADERQRADDLRAQIDLLNAEMTVAAAGGEADRRVAQARADHAETLAQAERERADRAEEVTAGARARGDSLRDRIETLQAELDRATHTRQEAVTAAEAIRQADDARRALGRWARIRRAWRGE